MKRNEDDDRDRPLSLLVRRTHSFSLLSRHTLLSILICRRGCEGGEMAQSDDTFSVPRKISKTLWAARQLISAFFADHAARSPSRLPASACTYTYPACNTNSISKETDKNKDTRRTSRCGMYRSRGNEQTPKKPGDWGGSMIKLHRHKSFVLTEIYTICSIVRPCIEEDKKREDRREEGTEKLAKLVRRKL